MGLYNNNKTFKVDGFNLNNMIPPISFKLNRNGYKNIKILKNQTVDEIMYLNYKRYEFYILLLLNNNTINEIFWLNQEWKQYLDNFDKNIYERTIDFMFPVINKNINKSLSLLFIISKLDISKKTNISDFKINNTFNSLIELNKITKFTKTKNEVSRNEIGDNDNDNELYSYKNYIYTWFNEVRLLFHIQQIISLDTLDFTGLTLNDISIVNEINTNLDIIKKVLYLCYNWSLIKGE